MVLSSPVVLPASSLTFMVPGEPAVKGRPRLSVRPLVRGARVHMVGHIYTPARTVAYERKISICARAVWDGVRYDGSVALSIEACFARPVRRVGAWKRGAPDVDNIMKIVMDGLTRAGIWKNDSQVAKAMIVKFYATEPSLTVSVEMLGE